MLQQDVQVPDDVWIKERKCLLMLLEARMLLRELVEYKVKVQRIASGNLTVAEIQHLLMVNNEDGEDSDFIAGNIYAPNYYLFDNIIFQFLNY